MATERKQIGGAKITGSGTQPVIRTDALASVVGRKTPVPITSSGNLALHGRVQDLTHRGAGFTAGEST